MINRLSLFFIFFTSTSMAAPLMRAPSATYLPNYDDFKCIESSPGKWQVLKVSAKMPIGGPFTKEKECRAALQTSRDNGSVSICAPMINGAHSHQLFDLDNGKSGSVSLVSCLISPNAKKILQQPDPEPGTVGSASDRQK